MADIPLKFGSKSQMLDMDAITKSIENTVLSQFQKLTSDLQSELKLELQVPSEITLEKKALNKEINRIKKEIDNALKSVSTEVFEKGLEDRWTFNHTGKYGTDKKDRPIKLKDYDKMVNIRDYKNQRLAMIHQLADITDEGVKIKDSKNLHQLIQNIKAYEEALRRLHELSDQKGQKYKPDEGELNFEKLFDGYKLAGDAKTNAEAIAKAFTSTYVSTLQSELEHKSADLTEVMRKIHRQVYRSAGEQEGVGYKYDKEEYSNAVRERQDAELHRDRNEAEIENRIRDEINAYIELENKLSDLFDQAGLDLSSDKLQELEEKADASISKLRQAIKYLDEYKIDLDALHNSYDFIQDGQESLRDYILNGYEQRTEISTNPQEGYLGTLVRETNKSIDAVAKAQKKEDNARQYLDYWKDLLLGLKDTEQMQEVVNDLSAEQIQSSLLELTNKNTQLQRRIEELEKEVADYKSANNSTESPQTPTVSDISSELKSFEDLEEKLKDVTKAISAKTAAFEDEHTKVTSWLSDETRAAQELNEALTKVSESTSGINVGLSDSHKGDLLGESNPPTEIGNQHQDDVPQKNPPDFTEFNNALLSQTDSVLKIGDATNQTTHSITTLGDAASKVAGTLENVSNVKTDDTKNGNVKPPNRNQRTIDWKVALSKYDQPFIYDDENNEKAMSNAFARVHMLSEDNRLFHQYIGRLSDDLAKYSTKDTNQQSLINSLTEIGRLTSEISRLERLLASNDNIDVESFKSEIERKTSELNQLKQSVEQTVSFDKPVYSEIVSQIMMWYERVLDTEHKLQDLLEKVRDRNPNKPEYADSLEDYFYNRVNPVKDAFDNKIAITTAKGVANTQKRLSTEDDRRAIEAQRIINSNQAQITKYEQLIESGKRLTADEEKHLAVLREEVAEQQKILDSINASAQAKEKLNALESKRENTVLGLEAKASRAQLNQSEKEYAESVKASERARAEAQAEEAKNAEIESKAFIRAANESTQQYLTAVKTIVDTTEEFIKLNSKIGRGDDLQNEESVRYNQVLAQRTQAYDVISKSNADPITIAEGERRMADAAELATAKILDEAKAFEELEKAKAKAEAERLAKQQEAEAKQMQADEDKRAINAQRIINSNQQQISDYQARLKNGEQLTQEEAEHLKILEDENVAASEILNTYRYSNDALDKIVSLEAKREKIEAKVNAKYSSKQAKQSAKEADDQQKAENIAAKNASEVIRKNYEQLERLRRKGASDTGFTEEDLQLFQRLTKESEEASALLANSKADASLLVELAGQRATEEDRVAAKLREELDIQERQKQRATSKMESDFVKLGQARLELLRSEEQLNYDNSNTSQARYKNAKLNLDQLTESIKRNAREAGISENTVNEYFQRFQDGAADAAADVKAEFENMRRSLGESLGTGLTQDDVRESLQGWVSKYGGSNLTDLFDAGIDKRGIHNFTASFKDAEGNIRKVKASLTELNGELFVTTDQGKKVQGAFQDFFDGVKQRLVDFAQYISSFVSAWQMINMLRQGFTIVRELDAAFVELKRISNDSTAALEDFRKKQFELADTVGSTSSTVMNAATEWEHLGYSIKEAGELAKTSAIYKNIADGMTSDSEATEDLVSILKAYNFTADQAMDVTDALIATSNNYAVTAADIGNILKRSSAALAMGGNTFEQTVALGTAMSEVLQSAEVAGSSLKVLSLRLRSSSTELKEMGEDVDDLVTSTPKLQQKIKALTKGFDILSSDGKTIKSTYEIMKGIAEVWDDMSDVDQAALLELIAGKTRAQGVAALLSNWKQVDNVLQTIAEDEGTALRNNEEKLNTINGRIMQLTNASQKLAQDAFNVDVIKGFISGVTGAVNALDALIRKIGVIPTALGAISAGTSFTEGGGFVGALSKIIDKRAQGRANMQKLSDVSFTGAQQLVLENLDKYDIGRATKELGKLSEAQKMVFDYMSANPGTSYKDALSSLRDEAEKASKTLFSFGNIGQTAFKLVGNAVLGMAAGAALQAVAKTISDAISYQDRLNQSASNYAAQMSSAQQSIAGYKTQIQDLSAKINDQNSSIEEVTKARESLRSLQAEMIDVYGREADGIDIVTQAINGNIDALDRLEAAQFRRQKGQMISEHSGLGDWLGRVFSNIFDWNMGDTGNVKHDTVSNDIKDKIEEYSINFSRAFKDTSNIAIVEALEKSKATYKWESNSVTGDVRDITATLQDMTSAADKEYRAGRMTDEEYSKFTNTISGMLAKVQETYDANIDWYNDMMRYDVVGNDEKLSDSYKKLEALAKKYRDNADDKDQRKQIIDEYNSIIDGINNSDSIDQNVKRYFNELYPSLKAEVGQWEFESKLTLKIDDGKTKSEIQKALDELQGTMGDKTITKEMLDNWDDAAHDSTQNAAYANYTQTLYANGASQVVAGNEAAASAGMLSTDNLEELKNQIHSINSDILKDVDETLLAAVKDVNGLPNKFKSIFNRIRRNFDNDTDAVIATLKLIPREAEKAGNQTEKSLSGLDLSDTAQHLNKLAEVIGKIQDKGTVPYTTLGTKDFEDAFGKIDDSTGEAKKAYDDFMKTVSSTKDMDEVIDKANKLATAYFNNSEQMKKLTADNAVFVEGMLSENGVSNAHEVVAAALAKQAASAELAAWNDSQLEQNEVNLRDATSDNIEVGLANAAAFIAQKDAADPATAALANLMFQEAMLSGADIDTTAAQASLQALGQAAGMSAAQIATAISLMNAASSAASKAAVKAKAAAANAGKNPRGKDGGVVWGSEEWNAQMAAYNQAKQAESIAEMNAKMLEDLKIEPIQTGSSGGGGGGGGGGNKEPSKTDKEWDWAARKAELLQRDNDKLRDAVNSEYVILQDREGNISDYESTMSRLNDAKEKLEAKGYDVDSEEFKHALDVIGLEDVADKAEESADRILTTSEALADGTLTLDEFDKIVSGNGATSISEAVGPKDEDIELINEYAQCLEDLKTASTNTSKTLEENGRGKLSIIEDLIESDKQQIEFYKQQKESYKKEYEGYKEEILKAFGEDEGPQWIKDIEEGNLDPEKEQLSTYDSNDQKAKDRYEAIDRALKTKQKEEEVDDTLHKKMQQLVEDEQERFKLQLNILKAKQEEIQSLIDEAQHNLDMKEILGEVVTEQDYRNLIDLNDDLIDSYRDQLKVLHEQSSELDEGEDAWYDVQSQIRDCESAIRDAVKQQAEWNNIILRMPVENISRFLKLVQNLGQTLKNWLSVNDAKGIAQTAEQVQTSWTTAYDQVADSELGIMKQLEDFQDLIDNYDLGSTKFSEVDDEIQSARDSLTQLVEEMIELNKTLLTLPIEQLSKMTTYLDGTLSDLQQIQSTYETSINAVIDTITKKIDEVQENYNELEKQIQKQIKPLQDQLDALQKANEKRDRELQIEQALYELEKAKEQKTVQVIRNGRVEYAQDESAIRNAQQGYDDALYNKLTGELQDKIDELNDQLAKAEEATNDEVDALNAILKRWQTIIPDTEANRNNEIASQYFRDKFGVENWQELVLKGKDENGNFADEEIYQGTRIGVEQNSIERRDTQRQIDVNNIITDSLTRLVDDFQADRITSEQLSAKVSKLMGFVSDGIITGQERLENTLSLGDYSNLGAALDDANTQRENQIQIFGENLKKATENKEKLDGITKRWDDFKAWYNTTYKTLFEQYKAIDFIGQTVKKWQDDDDDDDDNGNHSWSGPSSHWDEEHYHAGDGYYDPSSGEYHYSDGLEKGSIGGMTPSDKFKAIQALGLKKLDPDEFPAILHLGEGVINRQQQSTMLDNFRSALALSGAGTGAVIQMSFGDITLPSVTNGQDFAESLAAQFQPAMNQVFSKIFRR